MIGISAQDFSFDTDSQARVYLREIVEVMMKSFGISREDALRRINESWSQVDEVKGEYNHMYRELPKYWANSFYYGDGSFWWLAEEKRRQMGLPPLSSIPNSKVK